MTEDDLLTGLIDAMSLAGWRAMHVRRSDLAEVMGDQGWPDIAATPPNVGQGPLLVIECKAAQGRVTTDQAAWLVALMQTGATAAIVRPAEYDRALGLILAGNSDRTAWDWAWKVDAAW